MKTLVFVPWPETTWSAEDRVAGSTPLPLTSGGREQAAAWAGSLVPLGLQVVYSSFEPASVETARILARRCRTKHKKLEALAEVDAGLWDGLTTQELKRRYPRIFKRWYDDPSSVCPPEGEDLAEAFGRLQAGLERIRGKPEPARAAAVFGPLAFAVARCVIESAGLTGVRGMMRQDPVCYRFAGGEGPAESVPLGLGETDGMGAAPVAAPPDERAGER